MGNEDLQTRFLAETWFVEMEIKRTDLAEQSERQNWVIEDLQTRFLAETWFVEMEIKRTDLAEQSER